MNFVTVVMISDTHAIHDIDIPNGDILLHAGDATFQGHQHEVEDFGKWYSGFPHPTKIFIAGNHDRSFEDSPNQAKRWLNCSGDIIYLQDESVDLDINGVKLKIYGSPWQPAFCNWAFNLSQSALKEKWDKIPKDTDILITHGPPYKLCDITDTGEHVGCRELRAALQRVRPKIHLCGHIHEAYGVESWQGIDIINASTNNARYRPVNKPIVYRIYDDGTMHQTS